MRSTISHQRDFIPVLGILCILTFCCVTSQLLAASDNLPAQADTTSVPQKLQGDGENLIRSSVDYGIPLDTVAVTLAPGSDPLAIASELGAELLGPIAFLANTWELRFSQAQAADKPMLLPPDKTTQVAAASDDPVFASYKTISNRLQRHPGVTWFERQVARYRANRSLPDFTDPQFPQQWHLVNNGQSGGYSGQDVNVAGAWERGYTGKGVVIGIVDDSLEYTHADIQPNYEAALSYDFVGNDMDPAPVNSDETHGTPVAGIAAARDNTVAGVGAAYRAGIAGLRLLASNWVTDSLEARALSHERNSIDIYNNSWGPQSEQGAFHRGPQELALRAIRDNVANGRNGLGNIYVWAGGNGLAVDDNSNYDGYANLKETIGVAAVTHFGRQTFYSEPGASILVCAPSQGDGAGIVTSDITGLGGLSGRDFTNNFGGTSASAPLVAGVVALILEANPGLNWREVQHILVNTAVLNDAADEDWSYNGAAYHINHKYGFGLVDANAAVHLAETWPGLPDATQWTSGTVSVNKYLPDNFNLPETRTIAVDRAFRVEHVEVELELSHNHWGDLEIRLTSPSGTESVLAEPHTDVGGNIGSWTYTSVRHWGENSEGEWSLLVEDKKSGFTGKWVDWKLTVYGTQWDADANKRPVAQPEILDVDTFPVAVNILENDSDPDGDPLQVVSIYRPHYGQVTVGDDGILTYNPEELRGNARIGYTVSDGKGGVAQSFVELHIPSVPVARTDQVATTVNLPVIIQPLINDEDPDGLPLDLVSAGQPQHGTVSLQDDNTVIYFPPEGFKGRDSFSYSVTDSVDGEATGTVVVIVSESSDFAIAFDGVNTYLDAGRGASLNLTGAMTLEAWIHPLGWGEDYVNGYGRIVDKDSFLFFVAGEDTFFYNDHSLVFFTQLEDGSEAAINSGADTVTLGEWQHVVVAYDGTSTVRMYVNGEQLDLFQPQEIAPISGSLMTNWSKRLMIGDSANLDRGFEGGINQVRVWNKALSTSEIVALFNGEPTDPQSSLVGYWPMDEGSGNEIEDVSGRGNHALGEAVKWISAIDSFTDDGEDPGDGNSGGGGDDNGAPGEAASNYFTGLLNDDDGWASLDWLGRLDVSGFPLVWHEFHGWWYASGQGGSEILVYDFEPLLGWLWTTPEVYPFLWCPLRNSWLWYANGTTNPRWFFDYTAGEWIFL